MASGKALPMIIMGEDEEKKKKWIFTEQAKQKLAGINKPIASISIVGRYRSGKSFFMNQFDNKGSKFEISHSVKPCTKGIWMSAQDHPEDPGACLLLLDTEGLSDLDSDGDEKDVQIFALALLLSTSLILKVNDIIDNTTLKTLHLASSVASRYQSKKGDGNLSAICPTPQLFVIVRKFDLQLEGTEDQYLEEALEQREYIRVNFPERHCFCLPLPTKRCSELENDDNLMTKCREVITTILSNTEYIKVEKRSLIGKHLVELCQRYVVVLNEDDLDIPSQRQEWIDKVNREELEKFLKHYTEQMEGRFSDEDFPHDRFLYGTHEFSKGITMSKFHACKHEFGNDASVYEEKLKRRISEEFEKKRDQILKESNEKSKKEVEKCFATLEEKFGQDEYDVKDGLISFIQDKNRARDDYINMSHLGPAKEKVLETFLRQLEDKEAIVAAKDEARKAKASLLWKMPVAAASGAALVIAVPAMAPTLSAAAGPAAAAVIDATAPVVAGAASAATQFFPAVVRGAFGSL